MSGVYDAAVYDEITFDQAPFGGVIYAQPVSRGYSELGMWRNELIKGGTELHFNTFVRQPRTSHWDRRER